MRIALVCPYSWTYPGGVSRHIEALAGELIAAGHDARVLAPFDPDDALSRRLHRGARPERREPPEHLIPLGRTLGLPANGAVSNLSLFPEAVITLRRQLREGGYDVAHIHEPVAPVISWDALCCTERLPLVGTFHAYSHNLYTNSVARAMGIGRRMNRLQVRIAVSEAAAWTGRRYFGGRYRIVPNGVHVGPPAPEPEAETPRAGALDAISELRRPLRLLFVGQAVERKGLPVLLQAFEALREHVPATLTLVGASREEVAPLLLDDRGVRALGKVSEERKAIALAEADLLCAPSLRGESFGMVLTEAFASSVPVIASEITGYRDVVRDGVDGLLVAPGDPVALAEALRAFALAPERRAEMARAARERAERFAWRQVAAEVVEAYRDAIAIAAPQGRLRGAAVRHGLMPADMLPRLTPKRLASLEPEPRRSPARRALGVAARLTLAAVSVFGVAVALLVLQRIGLANVIASIVASKPGLIAAGLGLMCAAMLARGLAWHAILQSAPTWRRARRRDALGGTFIGVLMSATLPMRMGETSRALIVARRIGRARETLPIVLGSMVSQILLNLIALTGLGVMSLLSADLLTGHGVLIALALAPVAALIAALVLPVVLMPGPAPHGGGRTQRLKAGVGIVLRRLRQGCQLFTHPRAAALACAWQLSAWALQWVSCWLVMMALGLGPSAGMGGAAAVLFAVNLTGVLPATPANVGVFQAACVAVLAGAYHVSGADALAYGIILQAIELASAAIMGLPALAKEGISWRELRLRTVHAAPVRLRPLSGGQTAADPGLRP